MGKYYENFLLAFNRSMLKKKLAFMTCDHDMKEVLSFLIEHDHENAVAKYSTFCLDVKKVSCKNNNVISDFIQSRFIKKIILNSKARYYEYILSMAEESARDYFNRLMYPCCYSIINDVRNSLLLEPDSFFRDRIREWKVIFERDEVPYITKLILFQKLEQFNVNIKEELFKGLIEITPYYFLRRMQLPNMQDFIRLFEILDYLKYDNQPIHVLDYGCGSADLSLFLASRGHKITLCDVKDGILKAAHKRFEIRSLKVNYIGATPENPIPSITDKFQLVIALEVIEHIQNPLELLELIDRVLDKEGVVMLGSFPFKNTNTTGDHLETAVSQRDSLLSWIKNHWQRLKNEKAGYIFIKKQ